MGDKARAFEDFPFALGQLVKHKANGLQGIVVMRVLVQAQTGHTGNAYYVTFQGAVGHPAQVLEIELEAVPKRRAKHGNQR